MEFQGESNIPAPCQEVWDALLDPEVLKECIDGCQEMTQVSEHQYLAKVRARIGPVRTTFSANIQMVDVVAPTSYTLEVSATGGAAGFGKGSASISLEDHGPETQMHYVVNGVVGGKLAQIGSRLIGGVIDKLTTHFFTKFVERWTLQT
ncbi:MAG: carbon monoxide dehydrogenase subunit G [Gammaproteobacteria bacterium]|nr:carbon monoxide dehydrogenase subunit G [Gammaproteobacteria bacterium]